MGIGRLGSASLGNKGQGQVLSLTSAGMLSLWLAGMTRGDRVKGQGKVTGLFAFCFCVRLLLLQKLSLPVQNFRFLNLDSSPCLMPTDDVQFPIISVVLCQSMFIFPLLMILLIQDVSVVVISVNRKKIWFACYYFKNVDTMMSFCYVAVLDELFQFL